MPPEMSTNVATIVASKVNTVGLHGPALSGREWIKSPKYKLINPRVRLPQSAG